MTAVSGGHGPGPFPGFAARGLLDAAARVVDDACALALTMLAAPVNDWLKSDRSPVTDIDLAVDRLLRERLGALLPAAGWLSEETADRPDRRDAELVWIVDPIDGTRSLIDNLPEFCVSVALARAGVGPVLGIVANPRTGERFFAIKGSGAWNADGERLQCRALGVDEPLVLLVSRTELRKGLWENLPIPVEVIATSSLAYKMARVASGEAHATMTPWPRSEWDAAAGEIIAREAGCEVGDARRDAITYNAVDPGLFGVTCAASSAWRTMGGLADLLIERRASIESKYRSR